MIKTTATIAVAFTITFGFAAGPLGTIGPAWAQGGNQTPPLPTTAPQPASPPQALDRAITHTGNGVGLDLSTGLVGVFASVNVGLLLPKLSDRWQVGFRASWSMPAALVPHPNRDSSDDVVYLPWMVTGSFFFHYGTRPKWNLVRVYFGLEVFGGTTFATQEGLIGKNVTVGFEPYGGVEVYVNRKVVLFLEAGASGVFTVVYDDIGELGRYTQHGGTGFFIRFGTRLYLGR